MIHQPLQRKEEDLLILINFRVEKHPPVREVFISPSTTHFGDKNVELERGTRQGWSI